MSFGMPWLIAGAAAGRSMDALVAALGAQFRRVPTQLLVRSRLHASVSLAEATVAAHLSPSRFRRGFVTWTRSLFRAYLLLHRVH